MRNQVYPDHVHMRNQVCVGKALGLIGEGAVGRRDGTANPDGLPVTCTFRPPTCTRQMTPKISIRIVSEIGEIGSKQIAFLEAIQSQGSITQVGRFMGLSYRGARLLLEDINKVLCGPAVSAMSGGSKGGGAALTPVGTQLVRLHHAMEVRAQSGTLRERAALLRLVRAKND
jgi:molybdate transport system regulatory protein